jgi:hypothetical protein
MAVDVHRLFPVGIECCHCERWFRLDTALEHLKLHQAKCGFCEADMQLVEDMITDFRAALRDFGLRV